MRLVTSWRQAEAAEGRVILCPWLHGLDPATHLWLGVLGWHDANGGLLAALARAPERPRRATVFAAVFCADPFRSPDALFASLRGAGIAGIANLPSVGFIDGSLAEALAGFSLGAARELDWLRRARAAGLRVAGCAATLGDAEDLLRIGAELVVTHAGPQPSGMAGNGFALARRVRALAAGRDIDVVPICEVIAAATPVDAGMKP